MPVKIIATGSYLPPTEVSNQDLFSRVDEFDQERAKETLRKKGTEVDGIENQDIFDLWVRQVCGVENRHFLDEGFEFENPELKKPCEVMGLLAAKDALESSGIDPTTIDYVIFSSYTPTSLIPNPGCTISHYLGTNDAPAVHINTACSGFLDGMGLAKMMIESGQCLRVLVIAAEHKLPHLNFDDVTTCILFGDGAAAIVLENDNSLGGVLGFSSQVNYNPKMISMDYGKAFKMEGGPLVQRNAVNAMASVLEKACLQAGIAIDGLDFLFPHQANLRIILRLADKVKIPHEKTLQSVVTTGNCSSAAIGIGVDLAFKGKYPDLKFSEGDLIGFTVVGGGYTSSALVYRV